MAEILDNKQLTEKLGAISEFLNEKTDIDFMNMAPASTPKSTLAEYAMPSSKYVDLTLGATGSTYTAPANGYFSLLKLSTSGGQRICFYVNDSDNARLINSSTFSYGGDNYLGIFAPIRKGDTIAIWYEAAGSTQYFRFVYAEGEDA